MAEGEQGGGVGSEGKGGRTWFFDAREAVIAAALRLGSDAVPCLRRYLADSDRLGREGAAEALYRLGPAARPALEVLKMRAEQDRPFFGGKSARNASWAGVWSALALLNLDVDPATVLPVLMIGRGQLAVERSNGPGGVSGMEYDLAMLGRLNAALARGLSPSGPRVVPVLLDSARTEGDAQTLAVDLLRDPQTPRPLTEALLKELLAGLTSNDIQRRTSSALILGEARSPLRRPEQVKALNALLEDQHPRGRAAAAAALWKLGAAPERVRPALMATLEAEGHLSPDRLEALLQMGVPADEAPRWLELAIQRPDSQALVIFYRAAPDPVTPLLDLLNRKDGDARRLAVKALGQFGPLPVPGLVRKLSDEDAEVRGSAALLLERLAPGPAVLPALRPCLADPNPGVRLRAAAALRANGQGRDAAVTTVLLEALHTHDADRRREAAGLLAADLQNPEVLVALRRAALDAESSVRQASLACLARLGKAGADDLPLFLDRAARDPDQGVRTVAVRCAGDVSVALPQTQPDTARKLLPLLREPSNDLRKALRRTLTRMDRNRVADVVLPEIVRALQQKGDEDLRDLAEDVLYSYGPKAVPHVLPLLTAAGVEPEVRVTVLDLLADQEEEAKASLPTVLQALKDPDATVRRTALRAIRAFGPEAAALAVPVLTEQLKAADGETRRGAIAALERFGPAAAPALPKLLELAADRDASLRAAALGALPQLQVDDPKVLAALTAGLHDQNREVRWLAVIGLVRSGPQALPALRQAAASPDAAVRRQAVKTVGAVPGPENAAVLLRALDDADEELRPVVLQGLGVQGTAALPALPTLIKGLSDAKPQVRYLSALTLAAIGTPAREALPALRQARKDRDENVRRAVAVALEKIGAE
jgi:HEAT repeat protein